MYVLVGEERGWPHRHSTVAAKSTISILFTAPAASSAISALPLPPCCAALRCDAPPSRPSALTNPPARSMRCRSWGKMALCSLVKVTPFSCSSCCAPSAAPAAGRAVGCCPGAGPARAWSLPCCCCAAWAGAALPAPPPALAAAPPLPSAAGDTAAAAGCGLRASTARASPTFATSTVLPTTQVATAVAPSIQPSAAHVFSTSSSNFLKPAVMAARQALMLGVPAPCACGRPKAWPEWYL